VLTEIPVAQGFKQLEGTHLRACAQTLELRLQTIFLYDGLHGLFGGIDAVFLSIVCHKASRVVSDGRVVVCQVF
jgi:hypothetical protein